VLEEVSHSLGVGQAETARRVTLPLLLPGLGAGAALVFLASVTELTATLLLAPIGTDTLATEFWSRSYSASYGAAAPYALLMILVSVPATLLLARQTRRSKAS
jgi:iron(III) transport system permease protein